MKKTLIAALALASAASAFAAIPFDHAIVVNKKSGDSVEHSFADTPAATIEGNEIVFTVSGAKVSYPISDVANFTFKKTEHNGVDEISGTTAKATFGIDATTLYADGLTPGDELAVFSSDGKKISSAKADADGEALIEIGHLAPGAYIAAAANNSFKFIK